MTALQMHIAAAAWTPCSALPHPLRYPWAIIAFLWFSSNFSDCTAFAFALPGCVPGQPHSIGLINSVKWHNEVLMGALHALSPFAACTTAYVHPVHLPSRSDIPVRGGGVWARHQAANLLAAQPIPLRPLPVFVNGSRLVAPAGMARRRLLTSKGSAALALVSDERRPAVASPLKNVQVVGLYRSAAPEHEVLWFLSPETDVAYTEAFVAAAQPRTVVVTLHEPRHRSPLRLARMHPDVRFTVLSEHVAAFVAAKYGIRAVVLTPTMPYVPPPAGPDDSNGSCFWPREPGPASQARPELRWRQGGEDSEDSTVQFGTNTGHLRTIWSMSDEELWRHRKRRTLEQLQQENQQDEAEGLSWEEQRELYGALAEAGTDGIQSSGGQGEEELRRHQDDGPVRLRPGCLRGLTVQGSLSSKRRSFGGLFKEVAACAGEQTLAAGASAEGDEGGAAGGSSGASGSVSPLTVQLAGALDPSVALNGPSVPRALRSKISIHSNLPYQEFFHLLYTSWALLPSLASRSYLVDKATSTLLASLSTGVPLLVSPEFLRSYTTLDDRTAFVTWPGESLCSAYERIQTMPPEEYVSYRARLKMLAAELNHRTAVWIGSLLEDAVQQRPYGGRFETF